MYELDILERLETEVNACKRYAENSIKNAKKGKVGSAINFLDMAVIAKKYADRLHVEFLEVSYGKLTEEEFKIFCEAETLSQEINKAYIELKLMRKYAIKHLIDTVK